MLLFDPLTSKQWKKLAENPVMHKSIFVVQQILDDDAEAHGLDKVHLTDIMVRGHPALFLK